MPISGRTIVIGVVDGFGFFVVRNASAEKPPGTVSIETKSVAIGVGYAWGEGVLHFNGKDYLFKDSG